MSHIGGTGPTQPYAAPYSAPVDSRYAALVEAPPAPSSPALGRIALVLAIGAVLVAAVPAWVAAQAAGEAIAYSQMAAGGTGFGWQMLIPARDLILLGEIGVWTGLGLAAWALVQGIVAIRRRRGRGPGIAAAVIAVLTPFVLAAVVFAAFTVGAALGAA